MKGPCKELQSIEYISNLDLVAVSKQKSGQMCQIRLVNNFISLVLWLFDQLGLSLLFTKNLNELLPID